MMNETTNPTPATPAGTLQSVATGPLVTAQVTQGAAGPARPLIKTKLGIACRILGRGVKPGEVLIERTSDGAIRLYPISELQCPGGKAAIHAEIERVCAAEAQRG